MLIKLIDFIAGREPVATATGLAGVIVAVLGVAAAFGAPVTETQIAAIGALAAAVAGYAARRVVSPVLAPADRQVRRLMVDNKVGETTANDGQLGILVAILVILVLAMVGLFALCNGSDDENGMAVTPAAYHDGGDCDWSGDCGDDRYEQDYSSRDRNRNRGRNRGAFSPGPFDRSPVDIHDNNVCMPFATCTPAQDQPPADQPA